MSSQLKSSSDCYPLVFLASCFNIPSAKYNLLMHLWHFRLTMFLLYIGLFLSLPLLALSVHDFHDLPHTSTHTLTSRPQNTHPRHHPSPTAPPLTFFLPTLPSIIPTRWLDGCQEAACHKTSGGCVRDCTPPPPNRTGGSSWGVVTGREKDRSR